MHKITLVMLLLLVAACGARQEPVPAAVDLPPSFKVMEAMSASITDPSAKSSLAKISPENMPGPTKLEMTLLQAHALDKEEIPLVFDRLWADSAMVRDLALGKIHGPEYTPALALLHHLLVSAPVSDWQSGLAQTIYSRDLEDIRPGDLDGYALHFHCRALLLGGRFAQAVPFLEALEEITPPDVRAANQALARQWFRPARHLASSEDYSGKAEYPDRSDTSDIQTGIVSALAKSKDLIRLEISHILAGNNPGEAGTGITKDMPAELDFTSYKLISSQVAVLEPGKTCSLDLGRGRVLTIKFLGPDWERAGIEVHIMELGRELLKTVINTPHQGKAYIGAPGGGSDEQELIRIYVCFLSQIA